MIFWWAEKAARIQIRSFRIQIPDQHILYYSITYCIIDIVILDEEAGAGVIYKSTEGAMIPAPHVRPCCLLIQIAIS